MRKLILIIAAVAISHGVVYTQGCLPEGITFTTQAQIDSFQINYPGCTEIEGDVNIGDLSGNDISNLNGLNAISSIWGNLIIVYNPNLTSLTGLENLTSIGGGLTINNNLVLTSLSGLYNLDTIHGYFYFAANSNLFNLTGLESLTYIGGKVTFGDTDGYGTSLTSLAGLEGLTYIGGGLDLEHNPSLTSLEGLEGLNTIIGELTIGNCWDQSNYNLSSLVGLENINAGTISNLSITCNPLLSICDVQSICDYLAAPNGTVSIHGNAPGCNSPEEVEEACSSHCLPEGITFTTQEQIDNFQVNYPGCTDIEGDVDIGDWLGANDINNLDSLIVINSIGGSLSIHLTDLSNLKGLDSLTSIAGSLEFQGNGFLSSLMGLDSLSFIGGGLGFWHCPLTSLIELINLTSIGGYLGVAVCDSLMNLSGLDNVTSIEGSILILHDDGLISLSGLDNLTSINGNIQIISNLALTNLAGLDNVNANTIDSILIRDNISLTACEAQSVCDYLAAPGGTIEIHDNAPGCNSPQEVEEACETVSTEELLTGSPCLIFPNPVTEKLTLDCSGIMGNVELIEFYNIFGAQVAAYRLSQREAEITLDLQALPPGLYFLRLQAGNDVSTGKILKH